MGNFKKNGGERVGKGTYWNFRTEEKVVMGNEGVLPGNASDAYFRLPPLLVIAFIAMPSLVALSLLPHYASRLFVAQTVETVVNAYYVLSYILIACVFIALAFLAVGSVLNAWIMVTFRWKPNTAYFSGSEGFVSIQGSETDHKEEKKDDNQ